ncbi:MAG TPA: O-antigen ligase family protein [Xanthobacteraceae bacterium]|nr:O-antigen ligase family protein [Xanthobacteraceae bacterium]
MAFASPAVELRTPGAAGTAPLIDRLRLGSLWLLAAISGFVLIEPAPYEFMVLLSALVFVATGLPLRAGHLPLLLMLIFYNIGFATSLVPVIELENTARWTAISCFLSLTTLFFALALAEDTARRADVLLRGYIAAAVMTSIIAVVTYFRLVPGSQMFIVALRASATFKDPNVFGPFLVLPGLIVLQRIMFGRLRGMLLNGAIALLIAAGLFLSFSRGAWGHFAASAAIMLFFTYVTTRSPRERVRIIVFAVLAAVAIAAFIVALLSLDAVASLFKERASLVQNYDAGHLGRFGRHILGALMIFDRPLGVGPLQFNKFFPEDPHNSFLDAFMAGGWLGGFTFLALVLVTLVIGFRHVFARTPWQPIAIATYAAFVGEVGESYVIDVQHWRHYYLIMGMVWGFAVAGRALRRVDAGEAAASAAAPAPG